MEGTSKVVIPVYTRSHQMCLKHWPFCKYGDKVCDQLGLAGTNQFFVSTKICINDFADNIFQLKEISAWLAARCGMDKGLDK